MIRTAEQTDLDKILTLTKRCGKHMAKAGIFQWNDHYPNRAVFEKDYKGGNLYVLELSGNLIGCVAISTCKDKEYKACSWLIPDSLHLYVHRLAVDPSQQGKGHARRLMDFVELWAKERGCASVRLDTFSKNVRNQRFYERRGYKRLGNIYFSHQSSHPFYCYELVLQADQRTSEK